MCGIAGFAGLSDPDLLREITRTLERRGPDDEGFFEEEGIGLGMRRLSIIDLETGLQPISDEDGRCTVVFNGEIYNHRALRDELEAAGHRFSTRSDTEVIVHLFQDLGRGCVDKLRGMFAFALWDRKARSLFLARDRLGIKPLYYAEADGKLFFASELRALLRIPQVPKELDGASVREYTDLLYVSSPNSIFKAVRKLEPGCWLSWKGGRLETGRYWSPPVGSEAMLPEEAEERLDEVMRLTVAEQREADVPVGLFLSGGLDSSMIAAYLAGEGKAPGAYCLRTGHPAFDETDKARRVAGHLGLEFNEVPVDPRLDLEAFLDAVDEPLADSSAIATYWVSRACRKHMKVALTGIGGDELFGGYPRSLGARLHAGYRRLPGALRGPLARGGGLIPDVVGSRNVGSWARRFLEGGRCPLPEAYRRWMGHAPDGIFSESLASRDQDALLAAFAQVPGLDPVGRTLHADLRTYLPENLLALADRASMAASLELRVPLLDERIVELACRLPSSLRVRGRTLKYLPKRLLRRFLPAGILEQKKQGFMVPMTLWLRSELKERVEDCLSERTLRERGLFQPKAVRRVVEEHMGGRRDHPDLIWAILLLELWMRRHLPGAGR